MHSFHRFACLFAMFLAGLGPFMPARAAAPDAGFFTSYSLYEGNQQVTYLTCGASLVASGCFDSGSLGPFGRVGCIIEGDAAIKANSVTRAVYVVDGSSGAAGTGVTLYRYLKTDTIAAGTGNDAVTVKLTNSVPLTLVGSATAICSMAGNAGFLYIGTDQNSQVVSVKKGDFGVTEVFMNSTAYKIKYITSNDYGYVSAGFLGPTSNTDYLIVFTPGGREFQSGGGDAILLTPYAGVANTNGTPP